MKNIVIVIAFVATICLGAIYGSVLADEVDDFDRTNPYSRVYCLAHGICGEVQNCPEDEQYKCGSVMLNREKSPLFPDNLYDVLHQTDPIQYACVWDGNYDREPTETNWKVAEDLLINGSQLPDDIVYQSATPQGSYIYEHTDYHYYCGV